MDDGKFRRLAKALQERLELCQELLKQERQHAAELTEQFRQVEEELRLCRQRLARLEGGTAERFKGDTKRNS